MQAHPINEALLIEAQRHRIGYRGYPVLLTEGIPIKNCKQTKKTSIIAFLGGQYNS